MWLCVKLYYGSLIFSGLVFFTFFSVLIWLCNRVLLVAYYVLVIGEIRS